MKRAIFLMLGWLLPWCGAAFAEVGLRAVIEVTLDGVVVASPTVVFREGNPVDMYLENENEQSRLRVSMFSVPDGDKQHLRVQLFRSDGDGGLHLIGEPQVTVTLGTAFSVQVASADGQGFALTGTLERVIGSTSCSKADAGFVCNTQVEDWLARATGTASTAPGVARACCTRNCGAGISITCCGGCCSDPTNCPTGCCPQ